MNETVFALMSAFVVYGLSSLALPDPSRDTIDDTSAIVLESTDEAKTSGLDEERDAAGTSADVA